MTGATGCACAGATVSSTVKAMSAMARMILSEDTGMDERRGGQR
jgi:hypothetical protein